MCSYCCISINRYSNHNNWFVNLHIKNNIVNFKYNNIIKKKCVRDI